MVIVNAGTITAKPNNLMFPAIVCHLYLIVVSSKKQSAKVCPMSYHILRQAGESSGIHSRQDLHLLQCPLVSFLFWCEITTLDSAPSLEEFVVLELKLLNLCFCFISLMS